MILMKSNGRNLHHRAFLEEEDEREEKVKKVRFAGSVQVLKGILRSAYLLLFSGPPNQYVPFPQLPAMPR
ncbi:hypothetical protein SRHO_G00107470 [Serrasalmus rhombeus]